MRTEFDPDREREFVEALLAGDGDAVDRLTERLGCVPRILSARNARLGSPLSADDLHDVRQDTFVAVLRGLPNYEPYAPFESWVYGICCRQIQAAARAKLRRRRRTRELGAELPEHATTAPQLDDAAEVHRLLERIGGLESRIVQLKHLDGLTFEELAERLQISPNTAKTVYYRGLRKLRATLEIPSEEKSA